MLRRISLISLIMLLSLFALGKDAFPTADQSLIEAKRNDIRIDKEVANILRKDIEECITYAVANGWTSCVMRNHIPLKGKYDKIADEYRKLGYKFEQKEYETIVENTITISWDKK